VRAEVRSKELAKVPRVGRTFLHVQLSWRLDLVFLHSVAVVNFRLLQPMVHTTTLISEHRILTESHLRFCVPAHEF
jgi:hypothetical protein